MENGNYTISVLKTGSEESYLQLVGDQFQLGAPGVSGGTAGIFRVSSNPANGNQISMHVQVNENTAGYVNSFVNEGDEAILVIGSQPEYFNLTAELSDYKLYVPLEQDGESFEAYLTVWSAETDNGVYLDRDNPSREGNDRPTQKWRFKSVIIDDIVPDPISLPHGN